MGTAYVRPRKACATSSSIDHGRAIFTRTDHDRSPAEVKIPSLLDARLEALNLPGHAVVWATRSSEKLLSYSRPAHMADTTLQSRSPWGGRGRHPSCMLVDVIKAFIPSVQHDATGMNVRGKRQSCRMPAPCQGPSARNPSGAPQSSRTRAE